MLIGPAEIAALLPHAGAMCLIESVELCGDDQIICLTTTHLAAANPLRRHGRLGIMAGVEYASQAMALHAALQSQGPATRGYLASLRAVTLYTDRLDPVDGPPGGSGAIAESFGGHRQPVIVMAGSGGGSASPGALPPNPVMAGEGPPSTPCGVGLGKGVNGGPSPAMTVGGWPRPANASAISRRTLTIKAACQHREATRAVYGFALTADEGLLMDGRAVVIFNP